MAKNNILAKLMADRTAEAFDNGIRNILYTEIKPSEKNKFILSKIEDLAEDIKENGLDHNIVIREVEDPEYKYEIVAGERRYTAICQNIENGDMTYKFIPAKVQRYDDENAEKRLILNNLQSRVISPSEMLEAVESLQRLYKSDKEKGIKLPGRVRELIADDLGIGTTQVGTYQKVSKDAILEVKEMLSTSTITLSEASELAKLDEDDQLMFIQENEKINLQTIKEYRESLDEENVSVTDTKQSEPIQKAKLVMDKYEMNDEEEDYYTEESTDDEEEEMDDEINDVLHYSEDYEEHTTITGLVENITMEITQLKNKIKGVEFKEEKAYFDDMEEAFDKFKIALGL